MVSCTESRTIPADTATNTANTPAMTSCGLDDRFSATDLGSVVHADILEEVELGNTIADNTSYLVTPGKLRLYFFANRGPMDGAVLSAVSEDGLGFVIEEGDRLEGPYGHPKLFQLENGSIRMFHLLAGGLGSSLSTDGLTFVHEEDHRITNEQAELDKIGGMSVVALPDGGFRGYFSNRGIPGEPPGEISIKSAHSEDLLVWEMDEDVRVGTDAPTLTLRRRQPFALQRPDECVTLFYQGVEGVPTRLYSATSLNGLDFTVEHPVEVAGYEGSMAGANVQITPSGDLLLYYDAIDDENGPHIRAANLVFIPSD
jgi:hypothetical protein